MPETISFVTASAVGSALSAAIGFLWKALRDEQRAHQATQAERLKEAREDTATLIEATKTLSEVASRMRGDDALSRRVDELGQGMARILAALGEAK